MQESTLIYFLHLVSQLHSDSTHWNVMNVFITRLNVCFVFSLKKTFYVFYLFFSTTFFTSAELLYLLRIAAALAIGMMLSIDIRSESLGAQWQWYSDGWSSNSRTVPVWIGLVCDTCITYDEYHHLSQVSLTVTEELRNNKALLQSLYMKIGSAVPSVEMTNNSLCHLFIHSFFHIRAKLSSPITGPIGSYNCLDGKRW